MTTSNSENDHTNFKLELDTHANMPVVSMGVYIISKTGKTVDVNSYNPENGTLHIPIVDAALQYDDPFTGTTHILLDRNALHIPIMKNHLISPFILREAGIKVNAIPKVQIDNPDERDHSLFLTDGNLRILLTSNSIFSCLDTTRPIAQTLNECGIYLC